MGIISELENFEAVEVEEVNQEFNKNKSDIEAIEDTDGYKLIREYCEYMTKVAIHRLKTCDQKDFYRYQAEVAACEGLLEHITFTDS